MSRDDTPPAEEPTHDRPAAKLPVNDPRDDPYEKVAAHRRDVQAFMALRRLPRGGPDPTRH